MTIEFQLALIEAFQFNSLVCDFKVSSIIVLRGYSCGNDFDTISDCCLYAAPSILDEYNVEINSLISTLNKKFDTYLNLDLWNQFTSDNSYVPSIDVVLYLSSSNAEFKSRVNLLLSELSSISASCADMRVYGVTADAPAWADCKFIHHLIQGNADSIAHQAMQMYRLHVLAMSPFALACCDRSDMGDFFGTPENPSVLAEGWWIEGERRFEPKTVEDAKLIQNACAMMAVPERLLPNGGRWLGNALAHRGSKQPGLAPDQEPSPLIHVMNRTGLLMEEMPSATARIGVQVVCKMS